MPQAALEWHWSKGHPKCQAWRRVGGSWTLVTGIPPCPPQSGKTPKEGNTCCCLLPRGWAPLLRASTKRGERRLGYPDRLWQSHRREELHLSRASPSPDSQVTLRKTQCCS